LIQPHKIPNPHIIRLRGPWKCHRLSRSDSLGKVGIQSNEFSLSDPTIVRVPFDWADVISSQFQGKVSFRRIFHFPAEINSKMRIQLFLARLAGCVEASLNQESLDNNLSRTVIGESHDGIFEMRFEVGSILCTENELDVIFDVANWKQSPDSGTSNVGIQSPRQLLGEVRLEIYQ